jgi:hypothetical protein
MLAGQSCFALDERAHIRVVAKQAPELIVAEKAPAFGLNPGTDQPQQQAVRILAMQRDGKLLRVASGAQLIGQAVQVSLQAHGRTVGRSAHELEVAVARELALPDLVHELGQGSRRHEPTVSMGASERRGIKPWKHGERIDPSMGQRPFITMGALYHAVRPGANGGARSGYRIIRTE